MFTERDLPSGDILLRTQDQAPRVSGFGSKSENMFTERDLPSGDRLVFKAHRRVYHSTLGWRVIKTKKKKG